MPELPEVETIRRDLERYLCGLRVEGVEVCASKSVQHHIEPFVAGLVGERFVGFSRKGKLLECELGSGAWLLVHLKMTGQCIVRKDGQTVGGGGHPADISTLPNAHTRVIIKCERGYTWFFNDMRLFGWMRVANDEERRASEEALGPDAYLTAPQARDIAVYARHYPGRTLKHMLLDQGWYAGIGNIYADEIAYYAGILPQRRLISLKPRDMARLEEGIRTILPEAVALRGTSFRNFVDGDGQKGSYVALLKAYGRGGQSCLKCGSIMIKTVVAQRGTVYCPTCQR